jgi:uracil permease
MSRANLNNLEKVVGYLPDEKPTIGKTIVFAIQQFLVMLPATVLAALLMKFNIPTAIFASGVATLIFLLITKGKIPLYYGSSFSYIPAVSIVGATFMGDEAFKAATLIDKSLMGPIQIAIMLSGLISIAAGFVVNKFGQAKVDKILPATVTGPIAAIIGLSLAGNSISGVFQISKTTGMLEWQSVAVGLVTLLSIMVLTVLFKKGFKSQIPILIGMLIGVAVHVILTFATGGNPFALSGSGQDGGFKLLGWTAFSTFGQMNSAALPAAILAIVPVALVTIPESTAHVYQLDLYVNNLAKDKGSDKSYPIKELLGENLKGDGVGDIVSTFLGGPAGTNYGENISASAITKNFSSYVFGVAAIIAIILAFTPLATFTDFIPNSVVQGASIYLFGVIATQGIALMVEKKVDLFDPKNLAIIASVFVIGVGGHYALPNGGFPLYKVDGNLIYFPALAVASLVGILLNLLFNFIEKFTKENKDNNSL